MTQTEAVARETAADEVKQPPQSQLDDFYRQVQEQAGLHTPAHAQRWTRAVLNILGLNLDRSTRRALARALPPEWAQALGGVFRLLDFRDPTLTSHYFQRQVALRAGHTDAQFAAFPVKAVFHTLKQIVDREVGDQVAESLAPEVRRLWEEA
jgi:uncharacterized protein (DUF2267 family)